MSISTIISSFLFFFFFSTTLFSQFYCKDSDYSVCSRPYNCGQVSNVSYPFWGQNRPYYCGSTELLELSCDSTNLITSFQSFSQNFTVLKINTISQTMRLVRADIVYDNCTSALTNTSLNTTFFKYAETVHFITVFYGCPASFMFGKNNFTCKNDKTHTDHGFFAEVTEELLQQFPELETCLLRIQVPVLGEVGLEAHGNDDGIISLTKAASRGFEVSYHPVDNELCTGCKKSNGVCGINENAKAHAELGRFSCFCWDGFEALEFCYLHGPNDTQLDLGFSIATVSMQPGQNCWIWIMMFMFISLI